MMNNINSFFDRVCVINLKRRADRLREFQTSLSLAQLPWHVVIEEAVDGKNVTMPPWFPKRDGRGAYGCYMSHLSVIQKAKQDNLRNVLIFEDDCIFFPEAKDVIQSSLSELPDNWHFLYFGTEYYHRYAEQRYQAQCSWPIRISPHIVRCSNANRTHAYALNSTAFDMVINHLTRQSTAGRAGHIDHQYGILHEMPNVNCYVTYPNVCGQSGAVSNITGQKTTIKRWSIKMPYIKPEENNGVLVSEFSVGYGNVGVAGELGYENKRVTVDGLGSEHKTLSVHAPSEGVIECTVPIEIFAAQNGDMDATTPSTAIVDGREIGKIREKNSRTSSIYLYPGQHRLAIRSVKNGGAHTVWCYRTVNRNESEEKIQMNNADVSEEKEEAQTPESDTDNMSVPRSGDDGIQKGI